MTLLADVRTLMRSPSTLLERDLADPPAPADLLVTWVAPLAAIRPIAVLVSSLIVGSFTAGIVLGFGSFALQLGTWAGLSLVLPALAQQFRAHIDERHAAALVSWSSTPLWLAGVLFAVPEEPTVLLVWSRLLAALVGCYGLYVLRLGLKVLGVPQATVTPLLGAVALAALLIYGVLFVALGIASHVALFFIGAGVGGAS